MTQFSLSPLSDIGENSGVPFTWCMTLGKLLDLPKPLSLSVNNVSSYHHRVPVRNKIHVKLLAHTNYSLSGRHHYVSNL